MAEEIVTKQYKMNEENAYIFERDAFRHKGFCLVDCIIDIRPGNVGWLRSIFHYNGAATLKVNCGGEIRIFCLENKVEETKSAIEDITGLIKEINVQALTH